MSKYIIPVDDSRVRVMTGIYHPFDTGILLCYYVGYEDKHGTVCRLSDVSRDKWEATYALKHKLYTSRMIVTELPNGTRLYSAGT